MGTDGSFRQYSGTDIAWTALLAAAFLFALVVSGCGPASDTGTPEPGHQANIVQNGVTLPLFDTAQAQLNYARSGFTDKRTKGAALCAVQRYFEGSRLECGLAAIALAYLHLEPDYRFAAPLDIQKAADGFKAALTAFADVGQVQAKAHWYLGWLYTSILNKAGMGRHHYWTIVRNYPQEPMNLGPQVPWVNLTLPEHSPARQRTPVRCWSQAALLELVRHPESRCQALTSFDILFDRFYASLETGLAFKALLARPGCPRQVRSKALAWCRQNTGNPYLVRDITALAAGDT